MDTDQTFEALAAGRYFTCGLTGAGQAWCWGDDSRGQLGNGRTGAGSSDENQASPVAVLGDHSFTSIVAGELHACALTASGEAYCWGAYASGQLGNASSTDQTRPGRAADGILFATLAPGGDTHTCGVTGEGTAHCWGDDTFGELGTGSKTNVRQPTPQAVAGSHEFTSLALGRTHTCGLDASGQAWCWGSNDRGQLGDGTTDEHLAPVAAAADHRFTSLTAGDSHTCGVTADGAAYCWGENGMGQLGTGTASGISATAVAVTGGMRFDQLSAGEEFTCGVASSGTAFCWGSNRAGWLGTGSRTASPEPVAVISPER